MIGSGCAQLGAIARASERADREKRTKGRARDKGLAGHQIVEHKLQQAKLYTDRFENN